MTASYAERVASAVRDGAPCAAELHTVPSIAVLASALERPAVGARATRVLHDGKVAIGWRGAVVGLALAGGLGLGGAPPGFSARSAQIVGLFRRPPAPAAPR